MDELLGLRRTVALLEQQVREWRREVRMWKDESKRLQGDLYLASSEARWRKEAMSDAKMHLVCGDAQGAWLALNRHEGETHAAAYEDHVHSLVIQDDEHQ